MGKYDQFAVPTDAAVKKPGRYSGFQVPQEQPATPHPDAATLPGNPAEDVAWGRHPNDTRMERFLRGTDDFVRSMANSATFGGADKLASMFGEKDTEAKTRIAREESPYLSLGGDIAGLMFPGMAASAAVGKVAPALSGIKFGSTLGREAIAGAGVSAADQYARTGEVDPATTAVAGGASGLLGAAVNGISRILSPAARIRGAGSDLTAAEKSAAYDFAEKSSERGIDLTIPEALTATSPGRSGNLGAAMDAAKQGRQGAINLNNFNQGRAPDVGAAGRRVAREVGRGIDPRMVSEGAEEGIKGVLTASKVRSDPFYAAAESVRLPTGTPIPQGFKEAAGGVVRDPTVSAAIRAKQGGTKIDKGTVLFNQAVAQRMNKLGENADPFRAGILHSGARELNDAMESASPAFAEGNLIFRDAMNQMDRLKAGPLGTMATSTDAGTQGRALFGATNRAESAMVHEAMDYLSPDITRGVLVNNIESAVAKDPLTWGRTALPTEFSVEAAERAGGQSFDDLADTVRAARAIDPSGRATASGNFNDGGPVGAAYNFAKGLGSGRRIQHLIDPEFIKNLGETGPGQATAEAASTAGSALSANRNLNPEPGDGEMITLSDGSTIRYSEYRRMLGLK